MTDSESLREFLSSLDMVWILLNIERNLCKNPPLVDQRNTSEGLRGGAVVLLVASFEEFLRNCFEEHLSRISAANVRSSELPDEFGTRNVFANLRLAIQGSLHEGVQWTKDNIDAVLETCRKIGADLLLTNAFLETEGNPRAKVVCKMYRNIGIPDILQRIQPVFERRWKCPIDDRSIGGLLDDIVTRRNSVAHTGKALEIGRSTLRESVKFMEILARLLDAQLSNYVAGILP